MCGNCRSRRVIYFSLRSLLKHGDTGAYALEFLEIAHRYSRGPIYGKLFKDVP